MVSRPISVFACESQPVVVEGLRQALERDARFELAGVAARTCEALGAVLARAPDITLVDHEDDPVAALELVEELGKALSRTHAVLWVRSLEDLRASQALQAGARAILVKNRPLEMLLECLRVVARGHLWFENGAREPAGEPEPAPRRAPRLTPRERQVVTLLSQGLKNTEIARALEISPGTVKVHLMHVFEKTGARDRYELAIRSRRLLGPEGGAAQIAQEAEAAPGASRSAG
ncbi:MAG: LuxR C-terminal-related transcriptional regulator [Bryobacteraceae bacterium]